MSPSPTRSSEEPLIAAGSGTPLEIKLRLGYDDIKTTHEHLRPPIPLGKSELARLLDAGYRTAKDAPAVVALG